MQEGRRLQHALAQACAAANRHQVPVPWSPIVPNMKAQVLQGK